MIVKGNATTDPRAVVVHAHVAPLASTAVVRPGRLRLFTSTTVSVGEQILQVRIMASGLLAKVLF